MCVLGWLLLLLRNGLRKGKDLQPQSALADGDHDLTCGNLRLGRWGLWMSLWEASGTRTADGSPSSLIALPACVAHRIASLASRGPSSSGARLLRLFLSPSFSQPPPLCRLSVTSTAAVNLPPALSVAKCVIATLSYAAAGPLHLFIYFVLLLKVGPRSFFSPCRRLLVPPASLQRESRSSPALASRASRIW